MVQRSSTYYIDDGNVIFLVEQTLFKVHRYFFKRDSSVFQTMFELPQGDGSNIEGLSDENPIALNGISCNDFEQFLWVLYPPLYGDFVAAKLQDWCSILHLASQWEFASIRTLALKHLDMLLPESTLPPISRVVLARRYNLNTPAWLHQPYVELVARSESITFEEARELGLEELCLIACAREKVRSTERDGDPKFQGGVNMYYGGAVSVVPWEKRQSVWDTVADVLGLPQVKVSDVLGP